MTNGVRLHVWIIQCCALWKCRVTAAGSQCVMPSLPWKGMWGCCCCCCKLQDSELMLLFWLCDVGKAAVTPARACPAPICVGRSSYLTSLKGVPQCCEMGRDMSSSSSSIRCLSGKLPAEKISRGDEKKKSWMYWTISSISGVLFHLPHPGQITRW